MRVALLTFSLTGGGAQEVCRTWAKELANHGCSVEVLLIDDANVGEDQLRCAQLDGVIVTSMRDAGVTSHLRRLRYVASRLGRKEFDVVVSLETYPNLLAISSRAIARQGNRLGVVISEHNLPSLILRAEGGAKRAQLVLAQYMYQTADQVVAVSHAVAADMRCSFNVNMNRLAVIQNGVAPRAGSLPVERRTGDGTLTILVPARLVPQKRPSFCVGVLEELIRRGCPTRLIWVGDGPLADEINTAADRALPVALTQWRDDWYTLADTDTVVLLGSSYEGLGNVLVEAARRGIPAVAGSNALGCADAVIPGLTGYLAEVDNVESFADAIVKARRLDYRPGSIEKWLDEYTASSSGEKLSNVVRRAYRAALKEPKAGGGDYHE